MAYHLIRKKGRKEYHYLFETRRIGTRVKQFGIYLGEGKLSKTQISKLIETNKEKLNEKIANYISSCDPLYSILSKEQLQTLAEIKKDYSALKKEMYPSELENHEEFFTVEFTYDSNRIEGSTMSRRDVSFVLYEGLTPLGKSLREIYEASNHKTAYEFVKGYKGGLTMDFILKIHSILMKGILPPAQTGRLRDVQVLIRGAKFTPPKPNDVEPQLRKLIEWYRANKKRYHPAVLAAYFHVAFEGIHPFVDGNGRTGRLLLNYILLKNSYPPINIESAKKSTYIKALEQAHLQKNLSPFANMVANYIIKNQLVSDYRENVKGKRKDKLRRE